MVLPIVVFWGFCKICAIAGAATFCTHKVSKAYNKHQRTQREKIALKTKSINQAIEDNKKLQEEKNSKLNKANEIKCRKKERETEIRETQEKLNDKNISNEKRAELEEKVARLLASQEDDDKELEEISNRLNQIEKERQNNNKIVTRAGLDSDKHWIWDLITLENVIVLGGCYLLWQLVKNKDKEDWRYK